MFCNIPDFLHFVSTHDAAFLYHSQSKHILGKHGDNHNIFAKRPYPAADSPGEGLSITIWSADTGVNPAEFVCSDAERPHGVDFVVTHHL